MKITDLKVKNYKSFEALQLDNLLQLNMIYGYNNSGKSNILKFISLVFESRYYLEEVPVDNGDDAVEKRTVRQNFWEGTIIGVPYIFRIDEKSRKAALIEFDVTVELGWSEFRLMIGEEISKVIKSEIIKDSPDLKIKIKGQIVPSGLYDAQLKLIEVIFCETKAYYYDDKDTLQYFEGKDRTKLTANHFINTLGVLTDSVLFLDADRYFINEQDKIEEEALTPKNIKSFLFNLSLSDQRRTEFLGILNKLKDFKASSTDAVFSTSEKNNPLLQKEFVFEFVRGAGKSIDLMLTNGVKRLPISSFGSGIQQIIYQLIGMHAYDRKIVLIEEFELNLSPKYQMIYLEHLSKLVSTNAISQIFFTTHNPILSYRAEFRSIQVRIDGDGKSTAESITLDSVKDKSQIEKLKEAQNLLEHFHPSKLIVEKKDAREVLGTATVPKKEEKKTS